MYYSDNYRQLKSYEYVRRDDICQDVLSDGKKVFKMKKNGDMVGDLDKYPRNYVF